ncbi:serine/threonine-protein kinase MARK2 isoform X9 [Vespula maculifrons]|uniref:Uncharacterized protein n=2 Tax=Vespula TaxID=7451 RepID=A0A834NAN7_VESGE|nr:hypothetical protein HZH68_006999 [Vespula germanica]
MSASMRSTLQTVPESVPADHVTNSKYRFKPYHKAIQPAIYCSTFEPSTTRKEDYKCQKCKQFCSNNSETQ